MKSTILTLSLIMLALPASAMAAQQQQEQQQAVVIAGDSNWGDIKISQSQEQQQQGSNNVQQQQEQQQTAVIEAGKAPVYRESHYQFSHGGHQYQNFNYPVIKTAVKPAYTKGLYMLPDTGVDSSIYLFLTSLVGAGLYLRKLGRA